MYILSIGTAGFCSCTSVMSLFFLLVTSAIVFELVSLISWPASSCRDITSIVQPSFPSIGILPRVHYFSFDNYENGKRSRACIEGTILNLHSYRVLLLLNIVTGSGNIPGAQTASQVFLRGVPSSEVRHFGSK